MKIYDAYRMGIEAGMARDLRPGPEVQRILDDARAVYDSLPEDLKEILFAFEARFGANKAPGI